MRDRRSVGVFVCALLAFSCRDGLTEHPLAGRGAGGGDGQNGGSASSGNAGGSSQRDAATQGGASGEGGAASANGTADCKTGTDCASGVCLPDVTGVPRCCETDCRAASRVCSTAGTCVCAANARDVGGVCLLVEGQSCRQSEQCAESHCIDGVCCDAPCDRICERCDAPDQAGQCVLYTEDTACLGRTGFQCTARDRCRLPVSLGCELDADCDSEHCELAANGKPICCAQSCSGVCQRCGLTGACDDHPPTDGACPAVTCPAKSACVDYRVPAPGECSGNGQCATCTPIYTRAGIPCGIGSQCDGAGSCRNTGIGRVAAGVRHTCAIRDNGNVVCWGLNTSGQLGAAFDRTQVGDDEAISDVPGLEIDFVRDVVQLTAGLGHTCALFDDGNVRCWGRVVDNAVYGTVPGLLGTDQIAYNALGFVDPLTTGDVRLPGPAVQISAATSGAHTCALLANGQVVCWGFNADGECGNGTRDNVGGLTNENLAPLQLSGKAVQVKAGSAHTCVVLEDGSAICWGIGFSGRLGYGDTTDRLSPGEPVPVGGPVLQIAAGLGFTCGLLQGGRVRCWGSNNYGQLGYGHTVNIGDDETPEQAASLPGPSGHMYLGGDVQVGGGSGAVQITEIVEARAVCARFVGGAVRCWGENDLGQLGYGHTETLGTQFTPDALVIRPGGDPYPDGNVPKAGGDVQFGGSVIALADGGRCALVTGNKLYCWGDNGNGELGLPDQFPDGSKTRTPVDMGPVHWQ